jgi:hypothetical protein
VLFQDTPGIAVDLFAVVGDKIVEFELREFSGGVPQQLAKGGIGFQDLFALRIQKKNAVGALADHSLVALLAFPQRLGAVLRFGAVFVSEIIIVTHNGKPSQNPALYLCQKIHKIQ